MVSESAGSLAHGGELNYRIIGLAMRVHRRLGPGLLEGVYEACLCYEFDRNGIPCRRQVMLPVVHDEVILEFGCRADMIVADEVVVEIKATVTTLPVHEAQLLTYMRLSACHIGLLINFNTVSLTDGIRRCVL
jgi:GxxExxY protein